MDEREIFSDHERTQLLACNSFTGIECETQMFMENVVWKCSIELRSDEMERTHTHIHTHHTHTVNTHNFYSSFLDKVCELQNLISTAASWRTPGPLFNKGNRFVSQTKGKTKDFCSIGAAFCWVWRKLKERETAPRLERDCGFIITSLGKLTWN